MSNLKAFLESCSDDEINKGVAWLTIKDWGTGSNHKRKSLDYYCSQGLLNSIAGGKVNYCTNPNDAWPIMMANNITVFAEDSDPRAVIRHPNNLFHSLTCRVDSKVSLLRAAMEVYLLMEAKS